MDLRSVDEVNHTFACTAIVKNERREYISAISPCALIACTGRNLFLSVCETTRSSPCSIARAERDGTRAETRFLLSPKRTNQFKSVGASFQSTAGSRGVRISLSNAG